MPNIIMNNNDALFTLEKKIRDAFTSSTLNTRSCVDSMNSLLILYCRTSIPTDKLNHLFCLIIRGFQSKEQYLKHVLYCNIGTLSKDVDSFLAINSLLKDYYEIDNILKPYCIVSLFSVVPNKMIGDFIRVLVHYINNIGDRLGYAVYYDMLYNNIVDNIIGDIKDDQFPILFQIKNKTDPYYIKNVLHKHLGSVTVFMVRTTFHLHKLGLDMSDIICKYLLLKPNDEAVFLETCRQLDVLRDVEIFPYIRQAVSGCRVLLRNRSSLQKYAALRVLSTLSPRFPRECSDCNPEIESLVGDTNKSIKTLSLGVLLSTGTESTVDRLLPKVDFDNPYKYQMADSLARLCIKFPSRSSQFIRMLRIALLNKDDSAFKSHLVFLIGEITPICRDESVRLLCDCLGDSHEDVTPFILGVLSIHVPLCSSPMIYIPHIINRLILDNGYIRSVVLQTLSIISNSITNNINNTNIDSNTNNISNIVNDIILSCADDEDELVRDTAIFLMNNEIYADDITIDNKILTDTILEEEIQQISVSSIGKECADQLLSGDSEDVKVVLKKSVCSDHIDLNYSISLLCDDLFISRGRIGVLLTYPNGSNEEIAVDYKKNEILTVSIPISSSTSYPIICNSLFEYTIAQLSNSSECEDESIDLLPYLISTVDLFIPYDVGEVELEYSKTGVFTLECQDYKLAIQRVGDILNLRTMLFVNTKVIFGGKYNDILLRVEVEVEGTGLVYGNIDIQSNNEDILDHILALFE